MPRKKQVVITKEVQEFILDKISSGMHLSEVCRTYPDKCPTESGVHKYAARKPEFKAELRHAYVPLFMMKIDEYDSLSKALLDSKDDDRWAIKRIEVRMKSLEYQIKVIAPILMEAFLPPKQQVEVAHSGNVTRTVNVIDYSRTDVADAIKQAKLIIDQRTPE
jgi:hypothetical protein